MNAEEDFKQASGLSGDYELGTGSGTDDSAALQSVFDQVENQKASAVELPLNHYDYLLNQGLNLSIPGGGVSGRKLPSYGRGSGRKGNLVIGSGASYGIGVGLGIAPSDTVDNKADSWTFEKLGFLPQKGTPYKAKTGILFGRQTNGPDRFVHLDRISAKELFAAFTLEPARAGLSTNIANLVVTNSVLSGNRYAVYVPSGSPVYGLRFINVQAEHNNNGSGSDSFDGGAVHGDIQGAVTIKDCMLEGQPNAINLFPSRGRLVFEASSNYVEKNTVNNSQYVFRLQTNGHHLDSHAKIGPNFYSGNSFPSDYAIVSGKGSWTLEVVDDKPTTFEFWEGSLLRGSDIFPSNVEHFKIRGVGNAKKPEIYLKNGGFGDDPGDLWIRSEGASEEAPVDGLEGIVTDVPLNVGDLVSISVRVRCNFSSSSILKSQIRTTSGSFLESLGDTRVRDISKGDWVTINYIFVSKKKTSNFKFAYGRAGAGTSDIEIAGTATKNFGTYQNNGQTVVNVRPVRPIKE